MRQTRPLSNKASAPPPSQPVAAYAWLHTLIVSALLALVAGLVASLLAIIVMGVLRLLAGIPTPVELFGDFYLKHIDVHQFIGLLNKYSPNSKTVPLGLALLAMGALGTGLGLLYAALVHRRLPISGGYRPSRLEWLTATGLAIVMTLMGTLLFWDEIRQNLWGFTITAATIITILGLFVTFAIYALTLCLTYRALLPKQPIPGVAPAAQSRRQLLSSAGIAALTVGAGAGAFGVVRGYLNSYAAYDGMKTPLHNGKTMPITTNEEHYVVTQNTLDPKVNTAFWRLEVTGLVGKSGTYTYDELQNLPSTSRAVTLECIANGTGDHLMGTAIWQGVTLQTLLARHGGAQSNATHIAFYSVDGYTTSLPLKEVLDVDPLLVWRMNGAPLPDRHGFPLRVLIPGRYGEENPKWLTRLELTDHFVSGLYADQGWYSGPLHTTSRVDYPHGQIPAGQTTEVGGIAFAGNRGIQQVELTLDGGTTWQTTSLQPPLSKDSWVFWSYSWKPAQPGKYTLAVRATDGTGELQTSKGQRTVPNGATGYHVVAIQVV